MVEQTKNIIAERIRQAKENQAKKQEEKIKFGVTKIITVLILNLL